MDSSRGYRWQSLKNSGTLALTSANLSTATISTATITTAVIDSLTAAAGTITALDTPTLAVDTIVGLSVSTALSLLGVALSSTGGLQYLEAIDQALDSAASPSFDIVTAAEVDTDAIVGRTTPGQLTLLGSLFTTAKAAILAAIDQQLTTASSPSFLGLSTDTISGKTISGQLTLLGSVLTTAVLTYLAGINQALATSSSPSFAALSLSGTLRAQTAAVNVISGDTVPTSLTFLGSTLTSVIAGYMAALNQSVATTASPSFLAVNGAYFGTDASNNVWVGDSLTASSRTTVARLTAVGAGALASASTTAANHCVAVGYQALGGSAAADSQWCTAVGYQAGKDATGDFSTAVGYTAGTAMGTANTYFGYRTGRVWTGDDNCLGGNQSGDAVCSGTRNTAWGKYCLRLADTASSYNLCLGYNAGANLGVTVASTGCIYIGAHTTGNGAGGLTGTIVIGYGSNYATSQGISIGTSSNTAFNLPGTNMNTDGIVVSSSHNLSSVTSVTPSITFEGGIATDTVAERTAGSGVTVDGAVLVKDGGLRLDEKSSVPITSAAGKGVIWARNDAPNVAVFTDDAGTDILMSRAPSGFFRTSSAGVARPCRSNQISAWYVSGDGQATGSRFTSTAGREETISATSSGTPIGGGGNYARFSLSSVSGIAAGDVASLEGLTSHTNQVGLVALTGSPPWVEMKTAAGAPIAYVAADTGFLCIPTRMAVTSTGVYLATFQVTGDVPSAAPARSVEFGLAYLRGATIGTIDMGHAQRQFGTASSIGSCSYTAVAQFTAGDVVFHTAVYSQTESFSVHGHQFTLL